MEKEPKAEGQDAHNFLAEEIRATISRAGKESNISVFGVLGVLERIKHEWQVKLDRVE